ncbi:uncharacterized protein K02A2.6-like [Uranotaenia lowii]|uniref:uncharacterized protein K02A2.6-like n=1 Tax=Uranotaenia lowii TaxID=190385 RepID=UPI00247AD440|nr:uncharacterized protein K02A2.6-like [Uranotaenia lowii]
MKAECDAEVRTRLLAKIEDRNDVTLEQLSEDCQRLMCLKRDTALIEGTSGPPAVQFVERNYNRQQFSKSSPKKVKQNSEHKNIPPTPCWKCGAMHYTRECPYKDHKCSDCGNNGHREGYCLSENKRAKPYHKKQNKTFRANTVKVHEVQQKGKFVRAHLNGAEVQLQLDTGSDISVVSKRVWEKIGKPSTTPALGNASTASGAPLELLFKFQCDVNVNGQQRRGTFHVVDKSFNVFGIDLLDAFGLWSVPIFSFCSQRTKPFTSSESFEAAPRSKNSASSTSPQHIRTARLNHFETFERGEVRFQ